jgi:four helix bundle protein
MWSIVEMPTVKRFEDLHAWQASRELVKLVYSVSRKTSFERDYGLKDQIRRAAISAMSNIAEGFGAGSDAEFIKFLGYARRSVSETQSQLYAALDQGYILQDEFESMQDRANHIERQLNKLIGYLARSRHATREPSAPYYLDLSDDE